MANLWHKLKSAAAVGGAWLALQSVALAQAAKTEAPGEGDAPSYAISYGLVILGVGLGLAIALHGSNRRERAKPEAYGDRK